MEHLFQKTSAPWVKYSEYEWREKDGALYLKPAPSATPSVYNPLKDAQQMVLDALNVGRLQMKREKTERTQSAVMDFVSKYGLLGFMTALPTTPHFMDYDAVYLPKNHFLREESMSVDEYASQFFPFEKPDFSHRKEESSFSVNEDREMIALAMTFGNSPLALNLSFQRDYAEPYEWLATQFRDWAFTFIASFLYYQDLETADEDTLNAYRLGMSAFGGIAPTYHIELLDKPTIVWDFHSLLLGIQMMFSFMLADEKSPLRMCKHCEMVFAAGRSNALFCSMKCKNQFNVYKGREKKKEGG